MNYPQRILVLTLHSNENEFDECRASVLAQTGVDITHEVFSGYPNIEAHRILYRTIMERTKDYDLFVKLDADMVLKRSTALFEVVRYFHQRPTLDQLVVKVDDHFTGTPIFGVHIFSPRVSWDLNSNETLFVDPDPTYEGELVRDPKNLPIFVDHAPNPGRYQAFHFGFHRMLKVLQHGQSVKYALHTSVQTTILQRLENRYLTKGPANLGLAVLAADLVRTGQLSSAVSDKNNLDVERAFDRVSSLSDDEIRRRVMKSCLRRRLHYRWLFETARMRQRIQFIRTILHISNDP